MRIEFAKNKMVGEVRPAFSLLNAPHLTVMLCGRKVDFCIIYIKVIAHLGPAIFAVYGFNPCKLSYYGKALSVKKPTHCSPLTTLLFPIVLTKIQGLRAAAERIPRPWDKTVK